MDKSQKGCKIHKLEIKHKFPIFGQKRNHYKFPQTKNMKSDKKFMVINMKVYMYG